MHHISIDFTLPTGWAELSQRQLRYVYSLIANGHTLDEVKVMALLRWNRCKVVARDGDAWVLRHAKTPFRIKAEQLAEAAQSLDWLSALPSVPVRLDRIGRRQAVAADFQGVPFESFIIVENLYQGFLTTSDDAILDDLAAVLYPNVKRSTFIVKRHLSAAERINVFYWVASLKNLFARRFPDFFQPAGAATDGNLLDGSPNIGAQLQESMDAQIRALTKGDITKEREILSLDAWRALTELNAQAREYRQLNAKYNVKK